MSNILIRGGTVVTMTQDHPDGAPADILIENDRIAVIGSIPESSGAEIIDATGFIVIPGLIDSHVHTWQTGLRGTVADWTMFQYGQLMHATSVP